MQKWTQAQREAIEAENKELLVSAAAGSGKTAVLIERIMRLIEKGYHLNRMVIVTFTRLAAAQLRERLQLKLSEEAEKGNEKAHQELQLLPVTQIGTIHSFCGAILKEYFSVAGIDPGYRQVDEQRRDKYIALAMNEAMEECFEIGTEEFLAFAGTCSEKEMEKMVMKLYAFIMSMKSPYAWLDEKVEEVIEAKDIDKHPFIQVLLNSCGVQLGGLKGLITELDEMMLSPFANPKWHPVIRGDEARIESLVMATQNGIEALTEAMKEKAIIAPRKPKEGDGEIQWHNEMGTMRNQIKAGIEEAVKDIPKDIGRALEDLAANKTQLRGLREITLRFDAHFKAIKQKNNVLDFNDLEQLTLKVLADEHARQAIQNQYDHLFVDEYQDVGDAQEGIFQSIHCERNFLFMVGDVKQSIYRFRLCDPTLFLRKQETFSIDADAQQRKIFLNKNFRSEPQVLETVNGVFENVMTRNVTELDYDQSARLYAGRESSPSDKAELVIIPYDKEERTEEGQRIKKTEGEFSCVAELIAQQLSKDIYDIKTASMRKTRLRDMVILLPKAKGISMELSQVLQAHGIPAYADSDEVYFELPEVKRMMVLLEVIDNPRRDIAFLSVLKLPIFNYSDEELAQIRISKKETSFYDAFLQYAKTNDKGASTIEQLDTWQFRCQHTLLDVFIWEVMKESGLYLLAGAQRNGHIRQANLRLLCEHAANYQKVGHDGLYGFLQLGITAGDEGEKSSAKELSPNDDLVRIMTIHKSKGLEFPVVYIMGLSNNLQMAETSNMVLNRRLGIGMKYVDAALHTSRETLSRTAIKMCNSLENKAERARLLYVGMTRAIEKLVLIGTAEKFPKEAWCYSGEYGVFVAKTYLDWLCQIPNALNTIKRQLEKNNQQENLEQSTDCQQLCEPYKIRIWENSDLEIVENIALYTDKKDRLCTDCWGNETMSVSERLQKTFQTQKNGMPLKTSVSALVKNVPQLAQEESMLTKVDESDVIPPLSMHDMPDMPAFMKEKELNAAARGSAVHMALATLQFPCEIAEGLKTLEEKGVLRHDERKAIPVHWIENFAKSSLCQRMSRSALVKHEWAFNMKLPHYPDTLLQGVIDLCFLEEGEWILCDYKTNLQCDAETLLALYKEQMMWYIQALETITAKKVREGWLFALRSGEMVKVR